MGPARRGGADSRKQQQRTAGHLTVEGLQEHLERIVADEAESTAEAAKFRKLEGEDRGGEAPQYYYWSIQENNLNNDMVVVAVPAAGWKW